MFVPWDLHYEEGKAAWKSTPTYSTKWDWVCSKLIYHASWKWNDRAVCSLFSIRCSKCQYQDYNMISVEPKNLKIFSSHMLHLIERFDNFLKFFYSIRIFWNKKVYHIFIAIPVKFKLAKIRPLNLRINKNNGFPLSVFSCSTFYVTFLLTFSVLFQAFTYIRRQNWRFAFGPSHERFSGIGILVDPKPLQISSSATFKFLV